MARSGREAHVLFVSHRAAVAGHVLNDLTLCQSSLRLVGRLRVVLCASVQKVNSAAPSTFIWICASSACACFSGSANVSDVPHPVKFTTRSGRRQFVSTTLLPSLHPSIEEVFARAAHLLDNDAGFLCSLFHRNLMWIRLTSFPNSPDTANRGLSVLWFLWQDQMKVPRKVTTRVTGLW